MDRGEHLLADLNEENRRITPFRKSLVEVFYLRKFPLSLKEIQEILKQKKVSYHRVSLYRDLDFLIRWRIVGEVYLKDGSIRYEYIGRDHHHHFKCTSCLRISDVEIDETKLETVTKELSAKHKITINNHSLEFFGLCAKCQ